MKCNICGTESGSGGLIFGQGFVCSKDCEQIAQGRQKQIHDELLAEPLQEMPGLFETRDFERWALKFALHFLRALSPKDRARLADTNPVLLFPGALANEFKERILRHIKPCYVSEIEYRGHQRMFCNGEYCFRQAVPAEHIIEATKKAELIQ